MTKTAETKPKTTRYSTDKDGNSVCTLADGQVFRFRKPTLGDLDTIEAELAGKQLQVRSTMAACAALSLDGLDMDKLRAMDAEVGLEVTKAIETFPVFSS